MDIHTFAMQCSIDILPASLNVQFAKMMLHIFNVCLILNVSIRHIYSWIEFTMYGSILHKLNILCHNCDWRCLFIYVKKNLFYMTQSRTGYKVRSYLKKLIFSRVHCQKQEFLFSTSCYDFLSDPCWEGNNDK